MTRTLFLGLGAAALLPVAAAAFPDGAPWDALDDPAEGCAACHFGSEPVGESDALAVEGVGGSLSPGETYAITLRFAAEHAERMGFMAVFDRGETCATDGLEAHGAAVRSIAPLPGSDGAAWSFDWTAPGTPGPVVLHVGGVAANDDASPFGDVVHLKTLRFEVGH